MGRDDEGGMKITVIIPVYNVEDYIQECLESVISQTMSEDVECILIDDCGNDNSISIVSHGVAS